MFTRLCETRLLRLVKCHFCKIGRNASEEVVLQLVASKCLPILMNGSEACCLKQSDIRSLEFAVNRFHTKLFKTTNVNVIQDCVTYFNFKLPSSLLLIREHKRFCLSIIVMIIQYANCSVQYLQLCNIVKHVCVSLLTASHCMHSLYDRVMHC